MSYNPSHKARDRQHVEHRKNDVSDKARFVLVADRLGLVFRNGDGVQCPHCGAMQLQGRSQGRRCFCAACQFSQNMIGLAMRALNIDFMAALEWIEGVLIEKHEQEKAKGNGQ